MAKYSVKVGLPPIKWTRPINGYITKTPKDGYKLTDKAHAKTGYSGFESGLDGEVALGFTKNANQ